MRHKISVWLWLFIGLSLYSCKEPSVTVPQNATPTRDDNMALGNPSGVEPSPFNPNNYLIGLPTYSLSYNLNNGTAN